MYQDIGYVKREGVDIGFETIGLELRVLETQTVIDQVTELDQRAI